MGERTVEETHALLGCAKLDPNNFKGLSQTLYFDKDLNAADLFLFELEKSVLDHLEEGNRIVIKGENNDPAVACTDSQTFLLREAETSNALLLLPGLKIPKKNEETAVENTSKHVITMKHLYYELKQCRPFLGKVKRILEDSLFIGHVEDEADESVVDHCLTFEQILAQVQASEAELKRALKDINAVEINGFIRIIDFDYVHLVLQSCIDFIEEQEWGFDVIPLDELCHHLRRLFPAFIVKIIMKQHCKERAEDDTFVALDVKKVCAHIGEHLLRNTTKFHLDEFEMIWQEAVPKSMTVDFQQLRGIALMDRQGEPPTVSLFRVLDLPDSEEQRFEFLFEKKEKWLYDEIEPFIADLASNTATVSSLLTKNCRVSHAKSGEKLYSSRKLK